MPINTTKTSLISISRLGYLTVGVGVSLGIFGWVRAGAIVIAFGSVGVSVGRHGTGRVEKYLPLLLALALLALAIALPGNG